MNLHLIRRNPTLFFILFISSAFLTLSSCKKNKDKGTNVIEISDAKTAGKIKAVTLPFGTGTETVTVLTLKNLSTGSAGSVIVKLIKDDASVIPKAKVLPANSYTMATLEYVVPANGTVNVPMIINKSNLTVDTIYGIGFKIETVSAGTIATDAKSIVTTVDMRNKWDGRYRVTGTFTDIATPNITFTEQEANLITISPNQIQMIPKDLGIPGYLILSGTSLSYYGSFGPVFQFDATTNKITGVTNSYGQPASNTRSAQLDPSGTNQYDPNSKTFTVKFWMKQPNTITTPPHHRVMFINTFIYIGPRF